MDSLTHHPLYLGLNEGADLNVIGFADGYEGLVDFGVELGSNVFAVEGHLGGSGIAKVLRELFNVLDARVFNFLARDLLDCAERHFSLLGYPLPLVSRMHRIQLS